VQATFLAAESRILERRESGQAAFEIFLGSASPDSMIPFVDNALRYVTRKSILG